MIRNELGKKGEKLAVRYLKKQGYKIIEINYKTKLGEIDIIALDRNTLVFIEVKSRISQKQGLPQEAINKRKQQQIQKVAEFYLKQKSLKHLNCRFDVISVLFFDYNPEITLIKDAFWVE